MIPTYVSPPASPFDRGLDFGRANADAVRGTVGFYQTLFAEFHDLTPRDIDELGSQVIERVTPQAADLIDEIEGIASGASVSATQLAAVNARTEILAGSGPPECSVVGVDGSRSSTGTPMLAQNWDWHPDVSANIVLWTVQSEGGGFTTLTEAGILAKIGCNDSGVAVCLNIMNSTADGGVDGFPVHLALRSILQRCAHWNDVESLMMSLSFSASSTISVAASESGQAGNQASFEVSPLGTRRLRAIDGILLHTNHFLAPHDGLVDAYRRDWPDTVERLSDLRSSLEAHDLVTPEVIKEALNSHRAGAIAVCCHDADNANYRDRQATLASVYMSLDGPTIEVASGNPCQNTYAQVPVPGHTR